MDHEPNNDVLADQPPAAEGEPVFLASAAAQPLPVARLIAPPTPATTILTGPPPRPWGFWATTGWSALGAFIELLVSIVLLAIAIVPAVIRNPAALESSEFLKKLMENGLLLSLSTIFVTPIVVAYLFPVIRWRGWGLWEYLALRWSGWRRTLRWLAVVAAYMAISDTVTFLLGREIVSPFMMEAYRTAGYVPLLVFAVVLAAPFHEELTVRGFLYRGIASSRLGPVGAIVITAVLWSLLHVQYDWYGIAQIAVCGVLLGVARHRTGSMVPPMLMHILINAGATAEVIIKARMIG